MELEVRFMPAAILLIGTQVFVGCGFERTGSPMLLLLLGPLVGYFGTGCFSGFGAITAEIFPTAIRARAQGLTCNLGRGISALSPYVAGSIGAERGLSSALLMTSGAFLVAGIVALKLPETLGRELRWGR